LFPEKAGDLQQTQSSIVLVDAEAVTAGKDDSVKKSREDKVETTVSVSFQFPSACCCHDRINRKSNDPTPYSFLRSDNVKDFIRA
jgi:hypothetical protein